MIIRYLIAFCVTTICIQAEGQSIKDTLVVSAQTASIYRGSNPNIHKEVVKDFWTKQRGRELPKIHFDNWTGYSINLYVDSVYKGTIAAWGKASVYIFEGERLLYLQSVGGTREWRQRVRVPMEYNTIKLQ